MDLARWSVLLGLALRAPAYQNTTQQPSSTVEPRGRSYSGSRYGTMYNGVNQYEIKTDSKNEQINSNYYNNYNNQGNIYNPDYYKSRYLSGNDDMGGGSQTHDVEMIKSHGYEINAKTNDHDNGEQEDYDYDDSETKHAGKFTNYQNSHQSVDQNLYSANNIGASTSYENNKNYRNGNNEAYRYVGGNNGNSYNGMSSGLIDNAGGIQAASSFQGASVYRKETQQSLPAGYQRNNLKNSYLSVAPTGDDNASTQPYYAHSANYAQPRFHPYKAKKEKDEHKGEVILPPLSEGPATPTASTASAGATAPASAASNLFSQSAIFGELAAQGSDTASQSAVADNAPPSTGYGYPSPPPSSAGYSYPPPPPSNQYLPVPMTAPLPPPPPPLLDIPPPEEQRQADGFTYYYLGPKLWYIPLLFSIYFVIYVGALIIKAISKHKILFPQHLYSAASNVYSRRLRQDLDLLTDRVVSALTDAARRYIKHRQKSQ